MLTQKPKTIAEAYLEIGKTDKDKFLNYAILGALSFIKYEDIQFIYDDGSSLTIPYLDFKVWSQKK